MHIHIPTQHTYIQTHTHVPYSFLVLIRTTHTSMHSHRLRHKERSVRKFFLERDLEHLTIPPFVYLPLSGSTDEYSVLLRALPKEAVAFTTKARVPALMLFEEEVMRYDVWCMIYSVVWCMVYGIYGGLYMVCHDVCIYLCVLH
ncbi:hypothetical protein EON63_24260 [archaeon]|nr:MAG: hypothetical protein EON63_24260 [archaeon]